jgi:hypothetical protein
MSDLNFLMMLCVTTALLFIAFCLARLVREISNFRQDYRRVHGIRLL